MASGTGRPLRRAEFAAIAAAALFLALVVAAAALADGDEVLRQLGRIGAPVVLGLLALSLVNYGSRALRWHLFSRHLGLPVPLRRSGLYYVAGFSATTTPGKVGEALRLWFLERAHGCRYERTGALLVGDRFSDLTATLLLCLLGGSIFTGYLWTTLGVALALAGVLGLLMRPGLLLRLVGVAYGRLGRWPKVFARLRILVRATARLFGPKVYGIALVLALTGWLAESLGLYWLLVLMEAEVPLRAAIFVFAFAMLAGGLSMLPGGLGSTEAVMVALLLAQGTSAEVAIAATAVIRVTTLWFAVALGFLVLPRALVLARRGQPRTALAAGAG